MKGRTWCISFEDKAKKDGDVQVKYTVIDATGERREIRGTWEGYKVGDPPDKKAKRFFDKLNSPPYNDLVGATRAGNTVCFQLKDGAPYQDIIGVEVGDQSGQHFDIYDDPPQEQHVNQEVDLEVVRFRIEGTPATSNGEVRLGLGHVHPLARVPTHRNGEPLNASEILNALVDAFNEIYAEMGFTAHLEGDEVVVPKVPCKLGTRGGSNDVGLNYWISMIDLGAAGFSRIFDKPAILLDAIRLLNARLDFAGIPTVSFADPELAEFRPGGAVSQEGNGGQCETAIAITRFPGRIPAGTKAIDLKIKYTAQIDGSNPRGLTYCVINVLVEKIDNLQQKVVDRRLTAREVTSPAKDIELDIAADSDMNLALGNGVRITATLVCNECPARTDGPKLASVT